MPALKEVLDGLPGLSLLANSRLWEQQVERITPAALQGFVWKMKEHGLRDQAESALELALSEITKAVGRNELPVPPMLAYQAPCSTRLTIDELRRGFKQMGFLRTAACICALETGLTLHQVVHLTHRGLTTLRRSGALSELAEACLEVAPPRHFTLQYIFWEANEDLLALPLVGMDELLYNAFGLLWGELVDAYAHLILTDRDKDRRSVECLLFR